MGIADLGLPIADLWRMANVEALAFAQLLSSLFFCIAANRQSTFGNLQSLYLLLLLNSP
jgi:hypothetical protein